MSGIMYVCTCGEWTRAMTALPAKPADQCLACYSTAAGKRADDNAVDRLIADAEAMVPEDPELFDEMSGPWPSDTMGV